MVSLSYEEEEDGRVRYTNYARQQSYQEDEVESSNMEQDTQDTAMEQPEDGEEDRSPGPMLAVRPKEAKADKTVNPFKARSNPFKVGSFNPLPDDKF